MGQKISEISSVPLIFRPEMLNFFPECKAPKEENYPSLPPLHTTQAGSCCKCVIQVAEQTDQCRIRILCSQSKYANAIHSFDGYAMMCLVRSRNCRLNC